MKAIKIIRITIAAPFELISGEIYTRHENIVERNVIYRHKFHQYEMSRQKGSNRTPAKIKRK